MHKMASFSPNYMNRGYVHATAHNRDTTSGVPLLDYIEENIEMSRELLQSWFVSESWLHTILKRSMKALT